MATGIPGENQPLLTAHVDVFPANPSRWNLGTTLLRNVIDTTTLIGAMYLAASEYTSTLPNWTVISVCQLGGGAILRDIIENLLVLYKTNTPRFIELVGEFEATFGLPIYLILYNLAINMNTLLAQGILTAIRQAFVGNVLRGDIATLFKQQQQIYNDLDREKPIVTKLLDPDFPYEASEVDLANIDLNAFENLPEQRQTCCTSKGQLIKYSLITAAGGAMIIAGRVFNLDSSGAHLLLTSLGNFLALQGVGYFATDKLLKWWKKMEREAEEIPDLNSFMGSVMTSKRLKFVRITMRGIQRISTEVTCILYLFVNGRWIYLPLGALYGSIKRCTSEVSQTLTPEEHAQQQESFYITTPQGKVLKTSAKIKRAAAGVFFATSLAGMGYLYSQSPPGKDRIEAGAMIGSASITYVIAHTVRYLFSPGTCWRIISELYHVISENPYLIFILFELFDQFNGALDNQALENASGFNLICGISTEILYTAAVVIDFATAGLISDRLGFSTPFFRAAAFQEILAGVTGGVTLSAH